MNMRTLCVWVSILLACQLEAWEVDCQPETVRMDAHGKLIAEDRPDRRTAAFFSYDASTQSARMRAGRGGYVSFQLVVKNAKGGPFRVSIDSTSGVEVELFRAWYSKQTANGVWYPDALVPLKEKSEHELPATDNGIPNQTAQMFWVDVWVPSDAPDQASFKLSVWHQKIRLPVEVTVQVESVVYPAEDAITADHNAYGIGFVGASHPAIVKQIQGNFGLSDPCFRLIQNYHRIFYEHRGTFHQLGYNHSGGVHPAFAPELEGEGSSRRVRSWDAFDRHYGPLLDGSAFAGTRRGPRPVEGVYLPVNPEWPARHRHWGTPAYEAEFVNVLSEMEQHFREVGWTQTAFEMFFNHKKRYKGFSWDGDETRFPQDDVYFKFYGGLLAKAVPPDSPVKFRFRHDASWRMRGQTDALAGSVNHWVFAGFVTIYPELPALVKRRGDTAWLYGGANGVYAPVAAIGELPYRTWLMGLHGYTRWLTVDGRALIPTVDYGADTCLVYSGEQFGIDGPIPSIRLKLERNILQDIALLDAALRKAEADTVNGEAVREAAAQLFGLRLAELYRPDSPLKRQKPWEWSNASFAGNTGAGLFDRVTPDGELVDKVRSFAFDRNASLGVKTTGVPKFAQRPAPHPMAGYIPREPAARNLPEVPKPGFDKFTAELKRLGAMCRWEMSLHADTCASIVPARVVPLLFRKDPRDPWADSDNYDVDSKAFDAMKQKLAELAHSHAAYPVDFNLWLVLTREPLRVHACIRQLYGRSIFYKWGDLHGKPVQEQEAVLETGELTLALREKEGMGAALVPLQVGKQIIGFVEICARYEDFVKAPPVPEKQPAAPGPAVPATPKAPLGAAK